MATRKILFITLSALAILPGAIAAGRRSGVTFGDSAIAASGARSGQGAITGDPDTLPAACRLPVRVTSIDQVETGITTETFRVRWQADANCLDEATVTVFVTRQDGSNDSKTEKVSGSSRQALVKVSGFRNSNQAKTIRATVTVRGRQSGFDDRTQSF